MYRGLDLKILSKKSGLNVYSAAKHGAGVYDFLVFANNVPHNSKVLVSFSKPMFIRKRKNDYNATDFNLNALIRMYQNNYSFKDINIIFSHNIKVYKNIYESESYLYPVNQYLFLTESIDQINDFYSSIPNYLVDKELIYREGLMILKEKKCKLNLILFPYESLLLDIEIKSPLKRKTDEIKYRVQNQINLIEEVFYLKKDKRVMYDLTHLNSNGAKQVSDFLGKRILKDENHFYIIE